MGDLFKVCMHMQVHVQVHTLYVYMSVNTVGLSRLGMLQFLACTISMYTCKSSSCMGDRELDKGTTRCGSSS